MSLPATCSSEVLGDCDNWKVNKTAARRSSTRRPERIITASMECEADHHDTPPRQVSGPGEAMEGIQVTKRRAIMMATHLVVLKRPRVRKWGVFMNRITASRPKMKAVYRTIHVEGHIQRAAPAQPSTRAVLLWRVVPSATAKMIPWMALASERAKGNISVVLMLRKIDARRQLSNLGQSKGHRVLGWLSDLPSRHWSLLLPPSPTLP